MTREIVVGLENMDNLAPGTTYPSGVDTTWIIDTHPALYTGTLNSFYLPLRTTGDGGTIEFVVFSMQTIAEGKRFIKQSSSTVHTLYPGQTNVSIDLIGESVGVWVGNVIGIRVHCNSFLNRIGFCKPSPNNWNLYYGGIHDIGEWHESFPYGEYSLTESIAIRANGTEPDGSGGGSADACQSHTGNFAYWNTYNGYGKINGVWDCYSGLPHREICLNVITPWGEEDFYRWITENTTWIWERYGANPKEYYSITPSNISCLGPGLLTIRECWWRDSDTYYVKTTGNDESFGTTWAEAFKTITKVATKVPDGGRAYIGFGTYDGETAITPVNMGVLGISYKPVTAGLSNGLGEVIIPALLFPHESGSFDSGSFDSGSFDI